jgi:hypothetical protein
MNTLTIILWDVQTKKVVDDRIIPFDAAYKAFDFTTNAYEEQGWMMVNEINVDKNTIVREFATEKDGHLFDLIMCGGRVNKVSPVNYDADCD